MDRSYWQIAAGSVGRNYSDYFLRHGIAFVGGDAHIETMHSIKKGDIVILKSGLSQILAAGEVVERNRISVGFYDKTWLRDFDGWDLPAYCFVDWHVPEKPIETDGLTRSTIQSLPQKRHQRIANELLTIPKKEFLPEPTETKIITDDEILNFLVSKGLRPNSAEDLTNTFRRIRLLANYYYNECRWEDIREHETRTFLVVPLLLALGWSEQQFKIELPCPNGKIDIACFNKPYQDEQKDCLLIFETKDFSSGLYYAPKQVQIYVSDFPSCNVLVVTNGYCYKAYSRSKNGTFFEKPSAYLNILQPRDRYPLDPDHVDGCLEVLVHLLQ